MDDVIVRCPACNDGVLDIDQMEKEISHFGRVMISTLTCKNCGYRSSDVIPLESHGPKRYRVSIDGPDKLELRVVRSGTSVVTIPEIGGRIDPGAMSEGYVTNVEGILIRFRDILEQMKRDLESREQNITVKESVQRSKDLIEKLNRILERDQYEMVLTLIIEDPIGNSAIIDDDDERCVEVEDLTSDEIFGLLNQNKPDE